MTALQEQIQAIREQLDRANGAALPIGHILIALSALTDIVEKLAAKEEA